MVGEECYVSECAQHKVHGAQSIKLLSFQALIFLDMKDEILGV
jgi:hypothetical protein